MQSHVSLALIARNEESKLPACLESIASIADEIIVVDTGSTDRTKEVAAAFGAKVIDFPWIDDFAAARNECIRHATGEWIFWLDADERLDEVNREKLRRLFEEIIHEGTRKDTKEEKKNVAYVMKCLCVDQAAGGQHGTVVDHVRLFRNRPEHRWKYRVHEQILPALKTTGTEIRWTDIVIHHVGYQDPALTRHKLERNLRLLHLDIAEHPDDPYILFNLGWAYQELGKVPEALSFLHRSLQLSHLADSIVKKIYALLVQAHWRLGQRNDALAACRAGRARCPGDPELLYLEGQLLRETGQVDAAIASFRRLVSKNEINHGEHGEHGEDSYPRMNTKKHEESALPLTTHNSPLTPAFGSIEVGFTGYLARNQLAHLYYGKGMHADAEAEWRQVVDERPNFLPSWLGLGELYLAQGRFEDVDRVAESLMRIEVPLREGEAPAEPERQNDLLAEAHSVEGNGSAGASPSRIASPFRIGSSPAGAEGAILKARGLLARKDYEPARAILEELGARNPRWVYPRVILSHVLLQEGKDPASAERVLREIVDLDPGQAESWRNLAVLLRHQGNLAQAAGVCRSARAHCPQDVDLLLLQGIVLRESGDFPEAEGCLLAVVSGQWPVPKKAQECRIEARHQLAFLYVGTGRHLEAESQWSEVLAECPEHPAARQGLLDIRKQRGLKKQEVAGVS
jgi:glycosyltransferase involved in cell wall biosynthesis/Flp pilus assembly protein TadD